MWWRWKETLLMLLFDTRHYRQSNREGGRALGPPVELMLHGVNHRHLMGDGRLNKSWLLLLLLLNIHDVNIALLRRLRLLRHLRQYLRYVRRWCIRLIASLYDVHICRLRRLGHLLLNLLHWWLKILWRKHRLRHPLVGQLYVLNWYVRGRCDPVHC